MRNFIFHLEFFLAPLPGAETDELLALEDYLSYQAYNGSAKYVIESPEPKRDSYDELGSVEIGFEPDIAFIF